MSVLTSNILVPHGREEAWRFTPLNRLKGLHDGSAAIATHRSLSLKSGSVPGVTFERISRELLPSLSTTDDAIMNRVREFSSDVAVLKIAANTESLKGKTGYAMAGTKKGEEMIVATGTIAKAITDSFNKELDISKMREGLDGHLTAMGDALLSFSKGEIDFTELLGKASKGIADFTTSIGDVGGRVLKNLSDEGVKLREGNPTEQTAYYGTMAVAGYLGDAEKIKTNPIEDNKAVNKANPINTDLQKFTGDYRKIVEYQKPENLKGESKTYHSGKLNMDINVSMPAGMDKTTFESLMRTPEFREALLKMIHDAPKENNQSKVPAQR